MSRATPDGGHRPTTEGVSDHPELYPVAEAGWNRAHDVGPDDDGPREG